MADYVGDVSLLPQVTATDADDLMGLRTFAKGKGYIFARAGASLTKNTPYTLQYAGGAAGTDPTVKTALVTAVRQLVVVPVFTDLSSGDRGWFQFMGPVTGLVVASGNYTATHALKLDAGAVASTGAVPSNGDVEFASIITGGTTVTTIDVNLFGREALSET